MELIAALTLSGNTMRGCTTSYLGWTNYTRLAWLLYVGLFGWPGTEPLSNSNGLTLHLTLNLQLVPFDVLGRSPETRDRGDGEKRSGDAEGEHNTDAAALRSPRFQLGTDVMGTEEEDAADPDQ